MANLTLKEEYKGKVVIKQIPRMGEVSFDTEKVKPYEYENYSRMGFEECFNSKNDSINQRIEKINAQAEEVKEVEDSNEEDLELNLDLDNEELGVEEPKKEVKRKTKK